MNLGKVVAVLVIIVVAAYLLNINVGELLNNAITGAQHIHAANGS